MSIWVLHQVLTPQEETQLDTRTHVLLPFGAVPDLAAMRDAGEFRNLLRTQYPEEPPESISRRIERIWRFYSEMQHEDIVVVPLLHTRELALAEISGKYQHKVGDDGADMHLMPVRWYPARVSMKKLGKHKELFEEGDPLFEVTNPEARIAIRDWLPHSYNRFARWKWLVALFFGMAILRMLIGLVKGEF